MDFPKSGMMYPSVIHMLIFCWTNMFIHRQSSNISHTLLDNKLADHLDVVEASPVDAASITSSCAT